MKRAASAPGKIKVIPLDEMASRYATGGLDPQIADPKAA